MAYNGSELDNMKDKQIIIPTEGESKIDLFQKKGVRKVLHEGEWWFCVKDVVEALVDTPDGTDYVRKLRNRDEGLQSRWGQLVLTLPFQSGSGVQQTNFITIEGIFRLVQSVPTEKVESFKKWLARVGFERLQEIQNPELAVKRAITLYRAKGYDDEWIDARIRNKASRELLESEWDRHGMRQYIGLLTDAISVETFGIRIKQHKLIKGITDGHSLRDNMTPIELTLTTLGEQATAEITKTVHPVGLQRNLDTAQKGGKIAGRARLEIEAATGQSVVSSRNYLTSKQQGGNPRELQTLDDTLRKMLNIPTGNVR
jgi:prophage antirepressor-like protein